MVVKKIGIINIALLLGLIVPQAIASNDLTQLDLKKTSADSIDVTLFTSDAYNDNVLVKKKSDNKYVILIPKVQSSGFRGSSLNSVRDIVADMDVKTVNDTTGGYTKVTLITTKPVDIKTRTQKSAPLSDEQKEYNTLISRANAVKNTVTSPQPKAQQPKTEPAKIEQAKAPQTESIASTLRKKAETPKQEVKQEKVKKVETKPEVKLTEVDPEAYKVQNRRAHLQELINEVKEEQQAPEMTPEVVDVAAQAPVLDIEDMPQPDQEPTPVQNKNRKTIPLAAAGLLILFGLIKTFRAVRNILTPASANFERQEQNELTEQQEFAEQQEFEAVDSSTDVASPSTIDIQSGLSWQEKYKLYVDKSAVPVSRGENKGNYTFIKNAVTSDEIEQKRAALEELVSPAVEPEIVEVYSEDDVIRKEVKFKAFDKNAVSLRMTSRSKSRFKKYEVEIPLHEQKTVELGMSMLHTNPRSLADANLKVADVDKRRINREPSEYVMSSVEEYFSLVDKEQSVKPNVVSNPISQLRKNNKSASGLIIKSGFNIDENKGFYLVNKDGQNALVGKVNEEVFVLKKFDSSISNPLQVRRDNNNVYMVKADGFKSLIEVKEDKMGVLVEL